jgi:hypothetical protein
MNEITTTTKPDERESSTRSSSIAKLAEALAKAQGAIESAEKNKTNPHFKSNFADLASVWDACREQLSKNGLSVIQITELWGSSVVLRTVLMHSSGEFISGVYPVNPVMNGPQGLGSAMTYARRYALMAMVGIAPEDDDGHAAQGPKPPPAPRPASPTPRTAPNTASPAQVKQPAAVTQPTKKETQPRPANAEFERAPIGWQDQPATDKQLSRLYALGKGALMDHATLKEMAKSKFGVEHLVDLTKGQIQELFSNLEFPDLSHQEPPPIDENDRIGA